MTWSLNEVESLARKAARGGGMTWGLAEEAGRATRWLCAAGWPGAECLAALLRAQDGQPWGAVRPKIDGALWSATGGRLCPVAAGATLSDRAGLWAAGGTARLGPVAQPLLLVPFMASAADLTGARLALDWPGMRVTRGAGETHARVAHASAMAIDTADAMTITLADTAAGDAVVRAYRAAIPPDAARILLEFAHRTYAPATPQSRLAGAGAGLSDND